MRRTILATAFLSLCLSIGCSKNNRSAEDAAGAAGDEEEGYSDDGVEMMQEFGGMNEEKVTKTFKHLYPELSKCFTDAYQSHDYLFGDVAFLVKVDRTGKAVQAHAEESSLGNFEAERCMLNVLKAATWPQPVGGLIGLVRKSIGFDASEDVRPPVEWTKEEVSNVLQRTGNAETMNACGGGGPFRITAYIRTDGTVASAGISYADDNGDEAASCLVGAVEGMQFDSPGSWRAKVSFSP